MIFLVPSHKLTLEFVALHDALKQPIVKSPAAARKKR